MRPHRAGLVGLVLIFVGLGLAQSQQDALDILNKVGATYRGFKTLQAEGDVISGMTGPGMQQNMTTHILLTLTGSGKVRMESKTGMMNFLVISDGQTTWLYMPALNKYSKLSLGQTAIAGSPSIPGALPGLSGVGDFGKIADNIKEARLVRQRDAATRRHRDGLLRDRYDSCRALGRQHTASGQCGLAEGGADQPDRLGG